LQRQQNIFTLAQGFFSGEKLQELLNIIEWPNKKQLSFLNIVL
jgi:biotin operon repressor